MDPGTLYTSLYDAFAKCKPTLPGTSVQASVNEEWKRAKEEYKGTKTEAFRNFIKGRIQFYQSITLKRTATTLHSFFSVVSVIRFLHDAKILVHVALRRLK